MKIILRADSGFCREELMSWCEQNSVDYVFGLARNVRVGALNRCYRLQKNYEAESGLPRRARAGSRGRASRAGVQSRKSWCRARRVVAKAEQTGDKANPRFIVTSLSIHEWAARELYEELYCARGECENRIKEAQLGSFCRSTLGCHLPRRPGCGCGSPRPRTC